MESTLHQATIYYHYYHYYHSDLLNKLELGVDLGAHCALCRPTHVVSVIVKNNPGLLL